MAMHIAAWEGQIWGAVERIAARIDQRRIEAHIFRRRNLACRDQGLFLSSVFIPSIL